MTDKTKPATNERVAKLKEEYGVFLDAHPDLPPVVREATEDALSLVARIEAQQAEIEELKSERDVDVVGERDRVAKLLAEATKEIERLNDELQAQVESYRDRVSEIERLRELCGEARQLLIRLWGNYMYEVYNRTGVAPTDKEYTDLDVKLNRASKGESNE